MDIRKDMLWDLLIHQEEEKDYEGMLRSILAVLNADGGHYQHKYGIAHAAALGLNRFYALGELIDKVQFQLSKPNKTPQSYEEDINHEWPVIDGV